MNRTTDTSRLIYEFGSVSKDQWLEQVRKDLKGKDFATLQWQTDEGMVVEPYYTAQELEKLPYQAIQRAQVQGPIRSWQNREWIAFTDEKTVRQLALEALRKGADALILDLSQTDVKNLDFGRMLDGIRLTDTPVTFRTQGQSEEVAKALQQLNAYHLKGGLDDDALAWWMLKGRPLNGSWLKIADLIRDNPWPNFRIITVNSHPFHEAGANAAQELAFTLSAAVVYLDQLTDAGLSAQQVVEKMEFSVSIGTNYLMEIAKLRALRYLFGKICQSYGLTDHRPVFVHAQTSRFYQALSESYTNLLRSTTEAMAAIIGGADALTVLPHDSAANPSTEFSRRISRNVSTILKEEAYLDKVTDPAAGSYYLENLTYQLASRAWNLFMEVEEKGGLVAAFEQGWIQQEIEQSFQNQLTQFQSGKRVMVGVNKYRTEPTAETGNPVAEPKRMGHVWLLPSRRLAEGMEQAG
jgi:methylmalonyl-CoA mutase